jgi:hypothetical protein
MDYDMTAEYLLENAMEIDTIESRLKPGNANVMLNLSTNSGDLDLAKTCSLFRSMAQESSVFAAYKAFESRTMRENLRIPSSIWMQLEIPLKKRIEEIRREIQGDQRAAADAKPHPSSGSGGIPIQYPSLVKAKQAITEPTQDIVANLC